MSGRIAKRTIEQPGSVDGGKRRAAGAHEALPQTSPGGEPPETPAPFPSHRIVRTGRDRSRVRKPRYKRAPLTDPSRSRKTFQDKGNGASAQVAAWRRLPLVGPEEWDLLEEGKVCLTRTDLLMEDAKKTKSFFFASWRALRETVLTYGSPEPTISHRLKTLLKKSLLGQKWPRKLLIPRSRISRNRLFQQRLKPVPPGS